MAEIAALALLAGRIVLGIQLKNDCTKPADASPEPSAGFVYDEAITGGGWEKLMEVFTASIGVLLTPVTGLGGARGIWVPFS